MTKSAILFTLFIVFSCQSKKSENMIQNFDQNTQIATFAGGCFWCTEAVFLELEGVKSVTAGYTDGNTDNPTYAQVSSGLTGHAEATQIVFDPKKVSFETLLEVFFATHDPTTLNRQGADIGTQYRSEIYYHNAEQKQQAENYIAFLTKSKTFGQPIVTKISAAVRFFVAENYHQNYYNLNKNQSYCHYVITPKIEKVRHKFETKLKKN